MPTPQIPVIDDNASLDDLRQAYIGMARYMNYFLTVLDTLNISRLDAKVIIGESITGDKIAAHSITADKMNVNELSAITANLGEVIAGIITGLLIRTSEPGIYPRVEFDPANNMISFEFSPSRSININADYLGQPAITMSNPNGAYQIANFDDQLFISSTPPTNINISAGVDLVLTANQGQVRVQSWNKIYSNGNNETLDDALDEKLDKSNGINKSLNLLDENGNPVTIDVVNGQIVFSS